MVAHEGNTKDAGRRTSPWPAASSSSTGSWFGRGAGPDQRLAISLGLKGYVVVVVANSPGETWCLRRRRALWCEEEQAVFKKPDAITSV